MAEHALFQWPRWALHGADRLALILEEPAAGGQPAAPRLRQRSWGELAQQVQQLAAELHAAGFVPGDRLVHASGNSGCGVLIALASLAIGTIEVPLDPATDPATAQALAQAVGGRWWHRSRHSRSAVKQGSRHAPRVVSQPAADMPTPAAAAAALLQLHAQRRAEEPALILFTSGTGGKSKAVTLSRHNLASNAATKLQAVPQSPQDLRLGLLPICHAYARTCDLGTWLLSGCGLALTSGWEGWQRVAPAVRPTLVNTVPSVAARLLSDLPEVAAEPGTAAAQASRRAWQQASRQAWRRRPEVSRLRLLGCGGAALPAADFARFAALGVTVIQGYGMTEAAPVICSATPHNPRPGWVGRPVQGWQTRIDDDGRLWVRGDGMMIGYWNDPEETSRRVVDGWLDTGDLVEVDPADGQLRILGRADDRITLPNARKIHPGPIEQRVLGLPGVLHALLVPSGRHVELWIDVAPRWRSQPVDWAAQVARLLGDLPSWQRPRRVRLFAVPLAEIPGALTRKGTPVRAQVIRSGLLQASSEGWRGR